MDADAAVLKEALETVEWLESVFVGDGGLVDPVRMFDDSAMTNEEEFVDYRLSANDPSTAPMRQQFDDASDLMRRLDESLRQQLLSALEDYEIAMASGGETRRQYRSNVITSTPEYDQALRDLFPITFWDIRCAHRLESLYIQQSALEDAIAQAHTEARQIPDNLPAHGMYNRWVKRLTTLLGGVQERIQAETETTEQLTSGRRAARRIETELAQDPRVTFHDRGGFQRREIVDLTLSSSTSHSGDEDDTASVESTVKQEPDAGSTGTAVDPDDSALQDDDFPTTPAMPGRPSLPGNTPPDDSNEPETKTDDSTQPEEKSEAKPAQQGSDSPPPHKIPKTSHTQASPRAPRARSDGYIAIEDASSDEEPYDSGEEIDQVITPRLEQSAVEYALKESEERFDRGLESYRSTIPATLSSDGFFDSVSEILHRYGDVIQDLTHQVHNLRYPSGPRTPAELDRIRGRLQKRLSFGPPPAPDATARPCNGRMSDGSYCQLPWDECFLRHVRVHHDDRARTRCFGPSIKPGKGDRCSNNWLHCRVHNPKYLAKFHKVHGSKPRDDRGLVRSRSVLLHDIERTYGNKKLPVTDESTNQVIQTIGPQYPTAFTQRRRHERLAKLKRYVSTLENKPDFDSQGPEGPPDNHPGSSGFGQGPPPASGAAGQAIAA
ncbi:hypothetical protein AC1031_004726 [Aphanomyces cochlioides]|nr:hypothetical protein AC1031_004726 [Aphanomyces cochlioides]